MRNFKTWNKEGPLDCQKGRRIESVAGRQDEGLFLGELKKVEEVKTRLCLRTKE